MWKLSARLIFPAMALVSPLPALAKCCPGDANVTQVAGIVAGQHQSRATDLIPEQRGALQSSRGAANTPKTRRSTSAPDSSGTGSSLRRPGRAR